MRLHHINIKAPAPLLDEEMCFFRDVIGLTLGPRPAFDNPGYWLYAGDDPIVHLSLSQAHFSSEQPGYFDHVAFQTSELQALLQRVESAGLTYSTNRIDASRMTQVFLTSPTGTGIEVNCVDQGN